MTTEPGQDYIEALLTRADESLTAAKTLLEKCLLADSISRSYYAMFHAAQAILLTRGLEAKSHSGTHSIFGKEIVEKGMVPKDFGRIINKTHALRQKSDYDARSDFEFKDVEKVVKEADYFVSTIKKVIAAKHD